MKKVGIWLDQKEANIITLKDNTITKRKIYSEIETRKRIPGESKIFGRFGDQYLNDEKSKENKIKELTHKYLNKIVNQLTEVDEIILFGPAQSKIKLQKLLSSNAILSSKLKEVQNANKMTENQKVAFVKKYFNH
jgi:hypothetical protein